jgi:hypothetical protein
MLKENNRKINENGQWIDWILEQIFLQLEKICHHRWYWVVSWIWI